MITTSTALPQSRVMIDTIGDKTTVTLWDGTYTSEIVDGGEGIGLQTEYTYALYQLGTPIRPDLAKAVERNFDKWYASAKQHEQEEKNQKEAEKMTAEIEKATPQMLLDLDFEIMMMKEFGGII